jgi:integrase/recombinase XerD
MSHVEPIRVGLVGCGALAQIGILPHLSEPDARARAPLVAVAELLALRGAAAPDDPVFRSRKGGALDPSQVLRIVQAAAQRAGLEAKVSPHWLRHGYASHALDRGAPVHLVAATLGHASIATTGRYAHARPSDSSSRYLAV